MALGKTVHELETQLPAKEYLEWLVFMAHEPIGEFARDLRAARVANVIARVNGNKTDPQDFMPQLAWPEPAVSPPTLTREEVRAEILALHGVK